MTEIDGVGAERVQRCSTGNGDAEQGSAIAGKRADAAWLTTAGDLAVPWLIVYGHGPKCEELGRAIALRCQMHSARPRLLPIDEVPSEDLGLFPSLVLVVPTAAAFRQFRTTDRKITELVQAYRLRRPSGRQLLNPRTKRWYAAGVLQVVHPGDALTQPGVRFAVENACATHKAAEIEDLDTVDLFEVYRPGALPKTDQLASSLDYLWVQLSLWGITTPDQAHEIKEFIDQRRLLYEDPKKYKAMYRPVPQLPGMNHLVLVLEGELDARPPMLRTLPEPERIRAETSFVESSARAVRDLVNELNDKFPYFARPLHREGRKGSRKDLHNLYRVLRAITGNS
ncbi:hypothetical protein ACIOD2_37680 [Amycolatopsis sp. NPDC088138]|uniref:hypothetical protein n=1 Tax=Amycolatopsis sp. NPDC088138 TaxID=3363938 RepID=UPI00381BDEE4